jgi:hypothetical protein
MWCPYYKPTRFTAEPPTYRSYSPTGRSPEPTYLRCEPITVLEKASQ